MPSVLFILLILISVIVAASRTAINRASPTAVTQSPPRSPEARATQAPVTQTPLRSPEAITAIKVAELLIKKQLDRPATAVFDDNPEVEELGDKGFRISMGVDYETNQGNKIKSKWEGIFRDDKAEQMWWTDILYRDGTLIWDRAEFDKAKSDLDAKFDKAQSDLDAKIHELKSNTPAKRITDPPISEAQFQQIQEGMTWEQVVQVLGRPGTLKHQSHRMMGGSPYNLDIYEWKWNGGKFMPSSITVNFTNGYVDHTNYRN